MKKKKQISWIVAINPNWFPRFAVSKIKIADWGIWWSSRLIFFSLLLERIYPGCCEFIPLLIQTSNVSPNVTTAPGTKSGEWIYTWHALEIIPPIRIPHFVLLGLPRLIHLLPGSMQKVISGCASSTPNINHRVEPSLSKISLTRSKNW